MSKFFFSRHGSVNIKKLELDFERHREFGRNVQKVASPTTYNKFLKNLSKLFFRSAKLPAIQSPKVAESPKVLLA